jgi:RNA recognition motif-containing protein
MATKDVEEAAVPVDSPSVSNSKKRKTSVPEIAVDLSLPEPPSKKAKRALKKGKPLPIKPQSDSEAEDADEKAGADGEAKKKTTKKDRSPYGVWIGNLPFTITKSALRAWLVTNSGGAIAEDAITRVHIPSNKPEKKEKRVGAKREEEEEGAEEENGKKKGAQNKGFAYVDFSTFEANVAAIALSESDLGGRKLLIKDAKSFDGRPAKVEPEPVAADPNRPSTKPGQKSEAAASKVTKVFVGNLSFNTTEDELWAHFEKCGPIRWVKVATFEDTGKCKGYGWVNFQEPDAAQWASKGFVKIKETIETIEDFMEDGGEDEEADEDGKTQLVRREKVRKWWVNKLNGRTLKLELAEDDQLRYKKRFGKDAVRPKAQPNGEARAAPQKRERPHERSWKDRRDEDNAADPLPAARAREEPKKGKEVAISYHDDIQIARLTGAAVKPQGKKVTFD